MTRAVAILLGLGLIANPRHDGHAQARPVDRLDSLLTPLDAPGAPAAGIAVVLRGHVVYQRVTGWSDLGAEVRATDVTRFPWASIAKQFTAFGISRLVDSGRLDLEVPASRYLPELAEVDGEITIRDLLHHTAGLEDADGLLALAGFRPSDARDLRTVSDIVLRLRHLRFRPGDQHAYSNAGYVLLAEIIERTTGTPFETWMHREVFGPLGMTQSDIAATPDLVVPHEARPYLRVGATLRLDRYADSPGAGSLYATVGDMARWVMHLMSPSWEREATLRLRTPGTLRSGEPLSYAWGLGWGAYRGVRTLTHGGSTPAVDAFVLMVPEEEFAVVVAAAGQLTPNPGTLAYRAVDFWLGERLQPVAQPSGRRPMMITDAQMAERPPESLGIVVPDSSLDRLVGRYRMSDSTLTQVQRRGDRLELRQDGSGPWWPLNPLPDGRFLTMPLREAYRFRLTPDGAVIGISREPGPGALRPAAPVVTGTPEAEPRLTESDAARYLGWYHSPETLAWFEVVATGGRLVLRHARLGDMPLIQRDARRFGVESETIVEVDFTMGVDGQANGMILQARSWGVQVAFERQAAPAPEE